MKSGSDIVRPHCESIANILLKHMKDASVSATLMTHLFYAFSQLTAQADIQILLYLDDVMPILLSAMQDKA